MSENSLIPEIGEIGKESFENGCKAFSWTINNVSSLRIPKDNFLQCPSFSFKKGIWNLKIYPYGCTSKFPEGRIGIIMQRLHSEVPVHNICCRIFFSGQNFSVSPSFHGSFDFDLNHVEKDVYCELFQTLDSYKYNDTITLVCEILTYKVDSEVDLDFSKQCMSSFNLNVIGEIHSESMDLAVVAWRIPFINSIPIEMNNGVQSPSFAFADAMLKFKLFVHGQTKFDSKVDVMIEKTYSNVPVLSPISYEICFTEYKANASLLDYIGKKYCHNTLGEPLFPAITGFFKANDTQEKLVNVMPYASLLDLVASNPECDAVVLVFEIRILKLEFLEV